MKCVTTCRTSYYTSNLTQKCLPCNESLICEKCSGFFKEFLMNCKREKGEVCTKCIDNYFIVAGHCVSTNFSCSAGYYININNLTKQPECVSKCLLKFFPDK